MFSLSTSYGFEKKLHALQERAAPAALFNPHLVDRIERALSKILCNATPLFLKTHCKEIVSLQDTLIAHQIDWITPEDQTIWKKDRNFQEFVIQTRYHRIVSFFNQRLPIINGKPGIVVEGKNVEFDQFIKERKRDGTPYINRAGKLNECSFSRWGIIEHDPFKWETIFPFDRVEDTNSPCIEIATCIQDPSETHPSVKDHSWIRLIDEDGYLYSFGLFASNRYCQDGVLVSPDLYEMQLNWTSKIRVTRIPISKEGFEITAKKLEKWKSEKCFFNRSDKNCTWMIKELVKPFGVHPKTSEMPAVIIANKLKSYPLIGRICKMIPKTLKAIVCRIVNCVITIPFLLLSPLDFKIWKKTFTGRKKLHLPIVLRQWQKAYILPPQESTEFTRETIYPMNFKNCKAEE